ncbi:MAG TPA: hypothetical protein VFN38_03235, partial [Gemmatimonadaceae bacterium]|nr:hypothetical protein [Gemmatimonadaceae bacterium]
MSRFTHSVRCTIASLSALALGACADTQPTAPTLTPTDASLSQSPELNSRHVFHVKDFYAASNRARPSRTGISYHGGTVIAGPAVTKVVAIYWSTGTIYAGPSTGTGRGASDPTLIGSFLRGLGGSPYFNINTTYYNASNSHVLNQVGYTSFWSTGSDCAGP